MAAAQLDKLWDDSTSALSESYAESLDLLDQGKTAEAADRYRRGFVQTVKKLYCDAGQTYPLRFQAASCWAAWMRDLYVAARRAEEAFKKGDSDAARKLLPELRKQFRELHVQVGLEKSNDAIYAFLTALDDGNATADDLKAAMELVAKAEPSRKAKAETDAYEKAKAAWLQDAAGALDASSRDRLRASTLAFYKTFGVQFE